MSHHIFNLKMNATYVTAYSESIHIALEMQQYYIMQMWHKKYSLYITHTISSITTATAKAAAAATTTFI